MNTPKNWTPPPEMPADLPPLPMGKNGRPLIYCGKLEGLTGSFDGYLFKKKWSQKVWDHFKHWALGDSEAFYASASNSEFCRLNQWGDFDPRNKAVDAIMPQTTLAAYLSSAEAAIQEAGAAFQAATETAAAWAKELQARRDIRDRLQGDTAFARRAWFDAGRKCERHHGKIPTTFPALPD